MNLAELVEDRTGEVQKKLDDDDLVMFTFTIPRKLRDTFRAEVGGRRMSLIMRELITIYLEDLKK